MRGCSHQVIQLGTAALLFAAASALGDGALRITITNDNPDEIVITVYDLNVQPPGAIFVGHRINGFASFPVSITAGSDGYGHLSWSATTTDNFFRRCGSRDRPGLSEDDSVHVYAKSECGAPAQ